MNYLFLLKLISGLLDGTPTKDQIECVKKIVKEMIEENTPRNIEEHIEYVPSVLTPEAEEARKELLA